jgi:hypothetical protein
MTTFCFGVYIVISQWEGDSGEVLKVAKVYSYRKRKRKENPQNCGNVKINRNEWELQGQETRLIGPS